MKKRLFLLVALLLAFSMPAAAESRLIVRTNGLLTSLLQLKLVCSLLGCKVSTGLDGVVGQLYLVTAPDILNVNGLISSLLSVTGVLSVERDQVVKTAAADSEAVPPALLDKTPVDYYGTTVRNGYVNQPAMDLVKLRDVRTAYNVAGAGVVAVIDTGVDPVHPALQKVLLAGYDFTRNRSNGSESSDVTQSTAAMVKKHSL